jgi:hypothetical protein
MAALRKLEAADRTLPKYTSSRLKIDRASVEKGMKKD